VDKDSFATTRQPLQVYVLQRCVLMGNFLVYRKW